MSVYILWSDHTPRPWAPTEHRLEIDPDEKVFTDCCYRSVPARETICRVHCQERPLGGPGDYQDRDEWPSTVYKNGKPVGTEFRRKDWMSYASYYDPTVSVECNPEGDLSCKQHSRFKRGMHLREPI